MILGIFLGIQPGVRLLIKALNHFTYDPAQIQFHGKRLYDVMPILLQLWESFWPTNIMRTIVHKSNRYAETMVDAFGHTIGGCHWVPLIIAELRVFMALHIYMDLKKTTKCENILVEAWIILPLSRYLQYYEQGPVL